MQLQRKKRLLSDLDWPILQIHSAAQQCCDLSKQDDERGRERANIDKLRQRMNGEIGSERSKEREREGDMAVESDSHAEKKTEISDGPSEPFEGQKDSRGSETRGLQQPLTHPH